jgi:hypothetical protein
MKMIELIDTQPLIDKLQASQDIIDAKKAEREKDRTTLVDKYKTPDVTIPPLAPTEPIAMSPIQSISSSLAQIGGGGNIFGGGLSGGDPVLSIAREQLSVQEKIKDGILQFASFMKEPRSSMAAVAQ